MGVYLTHKNKSKGFNSHAPVTLGPPIYGPDSPLRCSPSLSLEYKTEGQYNTKIRFRRGFFNLEYV